MSVFWNDSYSFWDKDLFALAFWNGTFSFWIKDLFFLSMIVFVSISKADMKGSQEPAMLAISQYKFSPQISSSCFRTVCCKRFSI